MSRQGRRVKRVVEVIENNGRLSAKEEKVLGTCVSNIAE